jgi:hypothetical protein
MGHFLLDKKEQNPVKNVKELPNVGAQGINPRVF